MLVKNRMRWQQETEVLVVGYGGAGTTAALAAAGEGAEVLALEKQPADGHYSNTLMSGGVFISPRDSAAALQFKEAMDRAGEDLRWVDREVNAAWAEYTSQNRQWVESLGGKVNVWRNTGEHPTLPGYDSIDMCAFVGGPRGLMDLLSGIAASRGVRVAHGLRATKVLTDAGGRAVGLRAENSQGEVINIRAARAVVLTCGGYEFNEPMKLQYLKVHPTYFCGTTAATGDGVRMAQDVGAELWHMNCCAARLVMKVPGFPIAFTLDLGGRGWVRKQIADQGCAPSPAGFIIVDRRGKRYTRENFKLHSLYYELALYDSQKLEYPRVPSYAVFDDRRIKACALPVLSAGASGPVRLYDWSADNSVEIEKGWITVADNIRELAVKIGLDAETLSRTVQDYNGYCRHGSDPDFNRHPSDLIALESPPFYAVQLWPGGPNTQGGPRRNARAQVVNVDGEPIPGLYAAGELGSVYGFLYTGGGNVGECLAFGRIAGENAAREQP